MYVVIRVSKMYKEFVKKNMFVIYENCKDILGFSDIIDIMN